MERTMTDYASSATTTDLIAQSDRAPVVFAFRAYRFNSPHPYIDIVEYSDAGFVGITSKIYDLHQPVFAPRRHEIRNENEFAALSKRFHFDPSEHDHDAILIEKATALLKTGRGFVFVEGRDSDAANEVFAPEAAPTYEALLSDYLANSVVGSHYTIIIRNRDDALEFLDRQFAIGSAGLGQLPHWLRDDLDAEVDSDIPRILDACVTVEFLTPSDLASHRERLSAAVEPKNSVSL
jgi:hypothetical protein